MKKNILLLTQVSAAILLTLSLPLSASALSNPSQPSNQIQANFAPNALCPRAPSDTWNALYALIEKQSWPLPSAAKIASGIEQSISQHLASNSLRAMNAHDLKLVQSHFTSLYELIVNELVIDLQIENRDQLLAALTSFELGDQSTPNKKKYTQKLQQKMIEFGREISQLYGSCPTQANAKDRDDFSYQQNLDVFAERFAQNLPQAGLKLAFATAYQSCQSLTLAPINKKTEDLKGIKVIGQHPNGSGRLRIISDLAAVNKTHYYIKDHEPQQKSCFTLKQSPLIYDYGGKPAATSASDSDLDIFRNAGTGSAALGIDCSGYVFTSLASAGLKLSPNTPLKAISVFGVSAAMFKNPQPNGLKCLDKISLNPQQQLLPGDIIATSGHVVIVDEVGSDPFGIKSLSKNASCDSLSSSDFDFIIAQSSPDKNAIGINRIPASDYLRLATLTMKSGLQKYARALCKSQRGQKFDSNITEASVVRHRQTPECLDKPVRLARAECVQSCQQ